MTTSPKAELAPKLKHVPQVADLKGEASSSLSLAASDRPKRENEGDSWIEVKRERRQKTSDRRQKTAADCKPAKAAFPPKPRSPVIFDDDDDDGGAIGDAQMVYAQRNRRSRQSSQSRSKRIAQKLQARTGQP